MTGETSEKSSLLTADHYMLQEMTRRFAENQFPPEVLQGDRTELEHRRDVAWLELSALGLTGLMIDEVNGGSGGTLTDACVVAESLASELAPLPYVASCIAGVAILSHCGGGPDDLRRVASGEKYSLLVDRAIDWPPQSPPIAWGWSRDSRLIGIGRDGRASVATAQTNVVDDWFDSLQSMTLVTDVVQPGGAIDDGATRALAIARVGCAAQLLGLAGRAMEDAVSYAKQREQYGQLIGSFQAVQHLCAEMLVDVETSRSVVYGAAAVVEFADVREAQRAGAVAKAWTSEAALRVCETSIQVLGGIGITREHMAHLRLRDAHLFARAFGRPSAIYRDLAVQQMTLSSAS